MSAQANNKHWSSINAVPVLHLTLKKNNQHFVVLEGVSDEVLEVGLGRLSASYFPSDSGTVVIYVSQSFNFLQNLQLNDQIILNEQKGGQFNYAVCKMEIIDINDNPINIQEDIDELKMFTAWPFGSDKDQTTLRYIVHLTQLSKPALH